MTAEIDVSEKARGVYFQKDDEFGVWVMAGDHPVNNFELRQGPPNYQVVASCFVPQNCANLAVEVYWTYLDGKTRYPNSHIIHTGDDGLASFYAPEQP